MIVWTLEDEKIGTSSQTVGLAMSLGIPFVRKKIVYSAFSALPNCLKLPYTGIRNITSVVDDENPPDLIIFAGRRLVNLAIALKKRYHSKLIQLMDGGWYGRKVMDLVIIPKHDNFTSDLPNIVSISGTAHRLTYEKLNSEKEKWQKKLDRIPRPSLAVIVGGNTKNHAFTLHMAEKLVRLIRQKFPGYGIMLSTSRRTGIENERVIVSGLDNEESYIYKYSSEGDNPYYAFLATADKIIVTGDSMSMCSEAAFTGKPVFIFAPSELLSKKHARFHAELCASKHAVMFDDDTDVSFKPNTKNFNPNVEMVKAIYDRHLIEGAK